MISTLALLTPLVLSPQQNNGGPPVALPETYRLIHQFLTWPANAFAGPQWQDEPGDLFGASAVGDVNGFGESFFVIRGWRLFTVDQFETLAAVTEFDARTTPNMTKVNAVAVLEDQGFSGNDLVITANTNHGLMEHEWEPTNESFSATVFDSSTAAKRVTYAAGVDLDGNGINRDLLCVKEDSVLVWRRVSGVMVPGTTITATTDVGYALVCDLDDAVTGNEIVCMTNPIEVYSQAGVLLHSITISGTVSAIASIPPMPGETGDRLVIAYDTAGESKLQIRDDASIVDTLDLNIDFSEGDGSDVELEVTWLLTGDHDNDGREDIIVATTSMAKNVVLLRSDTGSYSTTDEDLIARIPFEENPGTAAVPDNVGQPAFFTAGPYSRNTVLNPVESLGRPTNNPKGVAIVSTPSFLVVDTTVFPEGTAIGDSGGPVIRKVSLSVGDEDLVVRLTPPVDTIVGEDTYVQMTMWRQDTESSDLDTNGGHVISWIGEELGDTRRWEVTIPWNEVDALQTAAPSLPEPPATYTTDHDIHWIYVRVISANVVTNSSNENIVESLEILDSSEWSYFALRMQPTTPNTTAPFYDDFLKNMSYVITPKPLINKDQEGGPSGSYTFGAVVITEAGGTWAPASLPMLGSPTYHFPNE